MDMTTAVMPTDTLPSDWRDFLALTKPRVMSLVVFTAFCGLVAAPGSMNPVLAFASVLAISLGAGAAGALNQWYEADIDALMNRTKDRPLPAGRMDRQSALHFGVGLSVISLVLMWLASNIAATALLALSILYYVVLYTVMLKRRTPQNIVIGGAAGAFPPVIGWAAVTGDVTLLPILMFALIFFWTPPHSWALALFTKSDYANAGVPMMSVVAGEVSTRQQVLYYTFPMMLTAIAPTALGYASLWYGGFAALMSVAFLIVSLRVSQRRTTGPDDPMAPEKSLFGFSILYLFCLFAALAADRMVFA
jgi:heme o synthase